jgi:hypothetical protein
MDTESEKKYILDNCSGSIYHQKEERKNTALDKTLLFIYHTNSYTAPQYYRNKL